jgi:hypothetical protein
VFGCNGYLLDEAVTKLPCAANLTALDLGSLESSSVVQALAHVAMPKLTWLSVRHDLVDDDCLAALTFPTLNTLRLEKNHLHGERVEALLEALPNLERLSIGDNTLGDQGVQSIAHSEHVAKLRHLEISSTRCSSDAVGALIEGGKLTELRSLELACNEDIKRKAIQVLATGPFDKLAHLSLSYISKTEIASLFAEAWLPSEQRGEDNYQRALNLDGTAVPHPRKAKKKKT